MRRLCGLFRSSEARHAMLLGTLILGLVSVSFGPLSGDPRREALPGIIGKDDRALLDTNQWPWIAVGRVNRQSGGFCTGTLIRPDTVITAAHCLINNRTKRRVAPREMHFLAGYNRGDHQEHARVRSYTVPDEATDFSTKSLAVMNRDWALLRLERPLKIDPIPIAEVPRDAASAQRLTLARVGYEQDRAHILSLHRGCSLRWLSADKDLLVHNCDLTRGGSGSPLLVEADGAVTLVGIAVAAVSRADKEHGIAVAANAFMAAFKR